MFTYGLSIRLVTEFEIKVLPDMLNNNKINIMH